MKYNRIKGIHTSQTDSTLKDIHASHTLTVPLLSSFGFQEGKTKAVMQVVCTYVYVCMYQMVLVGISQR